MPFTGDGAGRRTWSGAQWTAPASGAHEGLVVPRWPLVPIVLLGFPPLGLRSAPEKAGCVAAFPSVVQRDGVKAVRPPIGPDLSRSPPRGGEVQSPEMTGAGALVFAPIAQRAANKGVACGKVPAGRQELPGWVFPGGSGEACGPCLGRGPLAPRGIGLMVASTDTTTRAFEDFYRTRAPGLLRYAAVVAGPGLADDACQEAWLRMWRSWNSPEDDRRDAWARQVVRNCALDRLQARTDLAVGAPDRPAADPPPDEVVVRRDEMAALGACIRRLPSHLREVLWLREMVGLSYAEISDALGIPMGTVMSRLHSARRKLARRLVG